MSFVVDASRYKNIGGAAGYTTSGFQTLPSPAWLSSSSSAASPLMSLALASFGDIASGLTAYTSAYSGNTGALSLFDQVAYLAPTYTYDDAGRVTSFENLLTMNRVLLAGDVTLDLVDGQLLPVAIGSLDWGQIDQLWMAQRITYSYDADGNLISSTEALTQKVSRLDIADWRISFSTPPHGGAGARFARAGLSWPCWARAAASASCAGRVARVIPAADREIARRMMGGGSRRGLGERRPSLHIYRPLHGVKAVFSDASRRDRATGCDSPL
ncbi:hypothetical protein dqs_3120 [Azoarcus olearius]|nr:hypothetical protein dqs_3120 [Azoarcus olearius]